MTITPGTYAPTIPKGRPKSGRVWKSSRNRTSSILKKGVLQHLCKTFEEKEAARLEREKLKESIKYFKELEDSKKEEAKMKRIEREKRKAANEYKNSQYQLVS
jgi:rRNA-processing protein CGR1